MNYVYDVLLNFNKELYEYYDWNLSDVIVHIRKILLFKVDNNTMNNLKKGNILVESEFLNKISNRTEMFTNQNVKMINYAALFTNGLEVIGVKFDKTGNSLEKSYLLVDEESEILDSYEELNDYVLKYKVLSKNKICYFKTRKEREIEKFINTELKSISKNEGDKLKYLYYECFNKKENNLEKIIININKELKNNWDKCYMKIYSFFKLISAKGK